MSTITKTKSKHKMLLQDLDVKRWYNNNTRGSKITADVRLRRLGNFCKRNNMTPKDIIRIGKSDIGKLDDILLDFVTNLEKQYAPSYIADILKSVKSWMSFSYVESKRKIKIKNAGIPVTLANEVVLASQESSTSSIFARVAKVTVRYNISKAGHQYFTKLLQTTEFRLISKHHHLLFLLL